MTEAMLQNNLVGSVHLLSAVKEVGCRRLVFVGSPKEPPSPAWEDAVDSTYSASKASAAIYARLFQRLYGVPLVMPRPLLIYGPAQQTDKLVPYTIVSLLSGKTPQYSSGSLVVDFVYVLDVVRGLLHSAIREGLEGQSPDIGTGIGSRVRDVVQQLFDMMGHDEKPNIGKLPDRKFQHPHIADLEATRRLMGWEPLWTLQQGLSTTVEWYKAHWKEIASAK
jgi:UDP-glucose 4-epimerase